MYSSDGGNFVQFSLMGFTTPNLMWHRMEYIHGARPALVEMEEVWAMAPTATSKLNFARSIPS